MSEKKSGAIDRRAVLKTAGAEGLMIATGAFADGFAVPPAQALCSCRRGFAGAHVHQCHHQDSLTRTLDDALLATYFTNQ